MEQRRIRRLRAWMLAALVGLSMGARPGLCRIEPVGRTTGLIQFDAISETFIDTGDFRANQVTFARYWVGQDYYAVSVVWYEPHGGGLPRGLVILSDQAGLRMDNEWYGDYVPINTTYPKPIGERGPYSATGWAVPLCAGIRFAEAEALSRRVYVSDLGPLSEPGRDTNAVADLKVQEAVGGAKRRLAQLKVRAKGDRIESMDLFDGQQRPLASMRYEYGSDGNQPRLSRLVADLPVRPEKLAVDDPNVTVRVKRDGTWHEKTVQVPHVDHVSHKGGRTCTVTYKDVTVGDQVVRLPVHVEVRVTDDRRLLRAARLLGFRRVDMDKAEVWEAAKAFAHVGTEDWALPRLVRKYLEHRAKLGPMQIDPNDWAAVRALIAKYPVPEVTPPPRTSEPEARMQQTETQVEDMMQRFEDMMQRSKELRDRAEARRQELAEWRKRTEATPRPRRMEIEPNDLRAIRQLEAHCLRTSHPWTQELETELKTRGWAKGEGGKVPYDKQEISRLRTDLSKILAYHRAPPLPEDRPPDMDPNDLELIRRLQGHYTRLAVQQDRGLGGQLKAIQAMTCLDRMLKDHDALERHAVRYQEMLGDAGLWAMVMQGVADRLVSLMEAGQYDQVTGLVRTWAQRSAARNEADEVIRMAWWGGRLTGYSWLSVHLLDQFLKRTDLSPVQRYGGLALRALGLHKMDRLLAGLETVEDERAKAEGQWVLSTTTKTGLARMVEPAIRQAVSAWQSLGAARLSEAKPYRVPTSIGLQNLMGVPASTGLQEISARLDQIVRERTGQTGNRGQRQTEQTRPAPGGGRARGTRPDRSTAR